jgi:hypothetical protein
MLKRNTLTLHQIIGVYNDMFDLLDVILRAFAHWKTASMEDLYSVVTLTGQNMSKCYADITPTPGMLLISVHILNHFQMSESFWMWDKGIDTNPENETTYTAQYTEVFMKNVKPEYCAKHRRVSVNTPKKFQAALFPMFNRFGI